ncbi:MAG: hypothetical protein JST50_09655 [Bacteroidetes bacterium]|jgi:hypothetical protein|nr:hypothetical protein [Bacteroidota bacterium]
MKRIILAAILLCLVSFFAKAQSGNKVMLSLGPEVNFPFNTGTNDLGDTRQHYNDGIGGTLKAEFPAFSTLHITVSAGYMHYISNEHYSLLDQTAYYPGYVPPTSAPKTPPFLYLPIKAGLQYYYSRYMYINAEAGEAFKLNSGSKNSFVYSGGLGGIFPINAKSGIDLVFKYERGYETIAYPVPISQIGIDVAYKRSF